MVCAHGREGVLRMAVHIMMGQGPGSLRCMLVADRWWVGPGDHVETGVCVSGEKSGVSRGIHAYMARPDHSSQFRIMQPQAGRRAAPAHSTQAAKSTKRVMLLAGAGVKRRSLLQTQPIAPNSGASQDEQGMPRPVHRLLGYAMRLGRKPRRGDNRPPPNAQT